MDEKRDSETADDDDEEITEEITVYARVVCNAGYQMIMKNFVPYRLAKCCEIGGR